MLDKNGYDNLLADIDMTVFSHHRQQGLYVIYAMLLMGKPVYLRKETSSFKNFKSLGFAINTFDALANLTTTEILEQVQVPNINNQHLMKSNFTEQALAPQWSSMLNNFFEQKELKVNGISDK